MKISELRALLDRTSSEDMKRILVEVYRALPKKTREYTAIDELLKIQPPPVPVPSRAKRSCTAWILMTWKRNSKDS